MSQHTLFKPNQIENLLSNNIKQSSSSTLNPRSKIWNWNYFDCPCTLTSKFIPKLNYLRSRTLLTYTLKQRLNRSFNIIRKLKINKILKNHRGMNACISIRKNINNVKWRNMLSFSHLLSLSREWGSLGHFVTPCCNISIPRKRNIQIKLSFKYLKELKLRYHFYANGGYSYQ